MSFQVLATFIAACVLLGLTPGPNMSLILANTLSSGLRAGLLTLAGTTTGLALLVAGSRGRHELDDGVHVGMVRRDPLARCSLPRVPGCASALAVAPSPARRTGAGAQGRRQPLRRRRVDQPVESQGAAVPRRLPAPVPRSVGRSGLAAGGARCLFVAVLAAVDIAYTLAVAKARATLDVARLRLLDGASGVLLLLGGLALAMVRRP